MRLPCYSTVLVPGIATHTRRRGLRSLDEIQDMDGAAGDLYHHNSMGRWRMTEQVTLHIDNRVVAAPERLAEVIEALVLVERDARPGVGEAGVSGCECDAETGTPEDGADLLFCPHHTEPCQYHAHTGSHARCGLLLRIPGQHPSMPHAAANPSARRMSSSALGRPINVPVAAWR